VQRGEVRWYRFGSPDKRRPVLLLTRDSTLEFLGEVTIAPITRTVREIPSEVPLSSYDGLPSECAINLDHVQTVTKGKLGGVITRLSQDKMVEVRKALLFALGF
jgi:mRNA interferase MazF